MRRMNRCLLFLVPFLAACWPGTPFSPLSSSCPNDGCPAGQVCLMGIDTGPSCGDASATCANGNRVVCRADAQCCGGRCDLDGGEHGYGFCLCVGPSGACTSGTQCCSGACNDGSDGGAVGCR